MPDENEPEQSMADYDAWVASQAASKQGETVKDPGPASDDEKVKAPEESEDERIARAVQKALAEERERVAASAPLSTTPNHGGGIGVDHNEGSWSLYDQELALRGEHPLQNE